MENQDLNEIMSVGHVVRVRPGGRVEDVPSDVRAPEGAYVHEEGGLVELAGDGWRLVSRGYTRQYGYAGPVMHDSERIGRHMAEDIRERPGYYVVLTVDHLHLGLSECRKCGADEGRPCRPGCVYEDDQERETLTEGWVVAFRELSGVEQLEDVAYIMRLPAGSGVRLAAWEGRDLPDTEPAHRAAFDEQVGKLAEAWVMWLLNLAEAQENEGVTPELPELRVD